jgi:hypothetical protein
MSDSGWLCGLIEDGSNWPEKYLDDDVARFLDFCKDCELRYIEKYDEQKFITLKDRMRRDKSKDSGFCGCGCHPEQENNKVKENIINNSIEGIKTLRMYLESY